MTEVYSRNKLKNKKVTRRKYSNRMKGGGREEDKLNLRREREEREQFLEVLLKSRQEDLRVAKKAKRLVEDEISSEKHKPNAEGDKNCHCHSDQCDYCNEREPFWSRQLNSVNYTVEENNLKQTEIDLERVNAELSRQEEPGLLLTIPSKIDYITVVPNGNVQSSDSPDAGRAAGGGGDEDDEDESGSDLLHARISALELAKKKLLVAKSMSKYDIPPEVSETIVSQFDRHQEEQNKAAVGAHQHARGADAHLGYETPPIGSYYIIYRPDKTIREIKLDIGISRYLYSDLDLIGRNHVIVPEGGKTGHLLIKDKMPVVKLKEVDKPGKVLRHQHPPMQQELIKEYERAKNTIKFGIVNVLFKGKGEFTPVFMQVTPDEIVLKNRASSEDGGEDEGLGKVLRTAKLAGCTAGELKNPRKGHYWAFRLDLRKGEKDNKGDSKYVVSVENELEKSDWMRHLMRELRNPLVVPPRRPILKTYHQVGDAVFEDDKTLDDYNIWPFDTIYYDIK
jgi:hypothetical protein